jgi:hypothetical protein
MDNLESNFIKKLMSRAKTGMIQQYFDTVESITLPIFTEYSGKKKITPFRNTECIKPICRT